jgi:hypothetical protein
MQANRLLSAEKPLEKLPLGKPTRKWDNNITMDFMKIGYEVERWMELAQNHVQWQTLVLSSSFEICIVKLLTMFSLN